MWVKCFELSVSCDDCKWDYLDVCVCVCVCVCSSAVLLDLWDWLMVIIMARDIFSHIAAGNILIALHGWSTGLYFFRTRYLTGKGINPSCIHSIPQTSMKHHLGTSRELCMESHAGKFPRQTFRWPSPCAYLQNQKGDGDLLITSSSTVREQCAHFRQVYLIFEVQLTPKARCPTLSFNK